MLVDLARFHAWTQTQAGFLTKAREMGIPVEKLVTHHYKLDEYVQAMEKNLSLTGVKIAVCP